MTILNRINKLRNEAKIIENIRSHSKAMKLLTNEELGAKMDEFRERLKMGETKEDISFEFVAVKIEEGFRALTKLEK